MDESCEEFEMVPMDGSCAELAMDEKYAIRTYGAGVVLWTSKYLSIEGTAQCC